MFLAASFVINLNWKQAKHPSSGSIVVHSYDGTLLSDGSIVYIHTMECCSVMKGKKLSSHEKPWRNLKFMLLNERSQSEKAECCIIPTILHSGNGKTMERVKRSVFAQGPGEGIEEEHRGLLRQQNYSI